MQWNIRLSITKPQRIENYPLVAKRLQQHIGKAKEHGQTHQHRTRRSSDVRTLSACSKYGVDFEPGLKLPLPQLLLAKSLGMTLYMSTESSTFSVWAARWRFRGEAYTLSIPASLLICGIWRELPAYTTARRRVTFPGINIGSAPPFHGPAEPSAFGMNQRSSDHLRPISTEHETNENGYDELCIDSGHALLAPELPMIHTDPFDRMLVAQAKAEGITLVTADARITEYDGPIERVG
jgi:hypothetical protein